MNGAAFTLLKEPGYGDLDYAIDKLCEIIHEIIQLHKELSNHFKEIKKNSYNLKKKLVRDIVEPMGDNETYIVNKSFYTMLNQYIGLIDKLTIDTDLEYTYSEFDFRIRVKQPESIIYKLSHYNSNKQEMGRIPINKCLNDLLGFRVIMPNFRHNCELFSKMCDVIGKSYKMKYIDSSKGEYSATHIYFYGDSNENFPWELQVWLPEDFKRNHESHAKHKQEYRESAQIHKQALDEYLKEV